MSVVIHVLSGTLSFLFTEKWKIFMTEDSVVSTVRCTDIYSTVVETDLI
jgi:hypothetical protein